MCDLPSTYKTLVGRFFIPLAGCAAGQQAGTDSHDLSPVLKNADDAAHGLRPVGLCWLMLTVTPGHAPQHWPYGITGCVHPDRPPTAAHTLTDRLFGVWLSRLWPGWYGTQQFGQRQTVIA
jgi:hypothetical protein